MRPNRIHYLLVKVPIGNDAISLSKEFFWKKTDQNWRIDLQQTPTQMFKKKINNWKWFLGPIGGLSKIRAQRIFESQRVRAGSTLMFFKHTIFQTTQISYSTPTRSDTYCFLSGAVFVWSSNNGVMLQFQVG